MNAATEPPSILDKSLSPDPWARGEWLRLWLPLLLRNSRRIVGFVVAVSALSAVVVLLVPPRYQAEARLLPSGEPSLAGQMFKAIGGMPGGSMMASYLGPDAGADTDTGQFIGILRSRTVADHVLDRFDLMDVYGTKKRDLARETLAQRTSIGEERRTGQIVLQVTDKDPRRAAAMAQAYIDELSALSSEMNMTAAHRQREFLQRRVDEVNKELAAAAGQLSLFSKKNTVLAVGDQQRAMLEAAARMQADLTVARAELNGLEQVYAPNYYRVREVRARVAQLERELENVRGRDSDTGTGSTQLFPSMRDLPALGATYSELYKQTKTLEMTSELLNQQLELAKTEEVKQLPVIKVLDPPEVPLRKCWPPRTLVVLASALLAFFAICGWIVGRAGWELLSPEHELKVAAAIMKEWWFGSRFALRRSGARA